MLKNFQRIYLATFCLWLVTAGAAATLQPGMVRIPDGRYQPFFRAATDPKEVPVKAFALDILPVTNGDFLEFVRTHPQWQKSQVKR